MKYPRRLAALEKQHLASIARFTKDINSIAPSYTKHILEVQVAYAAINLLNCWANFIRAYYIFCASGAISKSGNVITSIHSNGGVSSYNDVLGYAINSFRPTAAKKADGTWDSRDEPTWHDSSTIITLATRFAFTNLADVTDAFTLGFTAHRNLAVFRNYYGHKNQSTMRKSQRMASYYSIQTNIKPTEILLSSPSGTIGSLIEVWKTELSDTISYLCH